MKEQQMPDAEAAHQVGGEPIESNEPLANESQGVNPRDDLSTSQLISRMWNRTGEPTATGFEDDMLDSWEPETLSKRLSSRRQIRWLYVLLALLIVALTAAIAWWVPRLSDERAAIYAASYADALVALHQDLASTEQALAVATDPTSRDPDLGAVAVGLAGVAESSAGLLNVANTPTPSPLPLSPSAPYELVEQYKRSAEPLAAEADDIRASIASIAEYRIALLGILATDDLPVTADAATDADQTIELSRVLANSVSLLNTMTSSGIFVDHRSTVETAVTDFIDWQERYLDALRTNNQGSARSLVATLTQVRQEMFDSLLPTLSAQSSELDGRIRSLTTQLAQSIRSLDR